MLYHEGENWDSLAESMSLETDTNYKRNGKRKFSFMYTQEKTKNHSFAWKLDGEDGNFGGGNGYV